MQTLSATQRIRRKSQPVTRRGSRAARQSEIGTLASCADGFLNHGFLPLCLPENSLPEQAGTEADFFRAAAELCRVHGFQVPDVRHLCYPRNILLGHRELTYQLRRKPYETELVITQTAGEGVGLSTKQVYEFDYTLYYIPVIPLYRFLRDRDNRASGNLLLAAMCYLYREAGVPYHRNDGFLHSEYEFFKEYHLEMMEEHPGEFDAELSEVTRMEICSDIMLRKIQNPYHLANLENTIARFQPQSQRDDDCLTVAREVLALYREFPGNHIWQNLKELENDEDWEDTASCDTYISFIGDGSGCLYDHIERNISDSLGNFAQVHQPTIVNDYNGEAAQPQSLEFEYRTYDLVMNLCTILYDMP